MDFREFLDEIYATWAKTTGAEKSYWQPEKLCIGSNDEFWEVYATYEDGEKDFIATCNGEEDSDFITAIHGALPDLVRRTHEALDEADRLDLQRDEQEIRIAGLEETINELNGRINDLEHDLSKASK